MYQKPLLGFSDFFDEVGAAKFPSAKATVTPGGTKTGPSGKATVTPPKGPKTGFMLKGASKRVFPKGKPSKKASPHKSSIQTAATVALKAKKSSDKINAKLKKEAAKHRVVIGAVKSLPRTAKQKAAQAKFARAQGRLIAVAKKAKPISVKVSSRATALKDSIARATPAVAKLFATPTSVPGLRGMKTVQRGAPPKSKPPTRAIQRAVKVGQDEDMSWMDQEMPTDETYTEDLFTDETFDPGTPPVCVIPTDVPLPVRTLATKEELTEQWETAPPDAIIYSGDYPQDSLASWNVLFGQNDAIPTGGKYPDGFLWGKFGADPLAWLVRDKVGIVRNDYGEAYITQKNFYENPTENIKKFWYPPASLGSTQAIARNSIAMGWGPLVGVGRLAGLQYAMGQDLWFWKAEHAPTWYSAVVQADAEIKRLNKEKKETAQATCDADRIAWELEKSTRERDRIKREYEMEMSTQEALTTQAIEQARLVTEQQQQQQQQEAAQAQFEQQQQQAELQYTQQQGQIEQQQQQMSLAQQQQMADLQQQIVQEIMSTPDDDIEAEAAADEGAVYAEEEDPSYEDTTAYSEPEAESDKFRHPQQDDDYEASGFEDDGDFFEDDGGFDDSGEDLVF